MLLNRPNELPRRTIKSIRLFQSDADFGISGPQWSLLFELGTLDETAKRDAVNASEGVSTSLSGPEQHNSALKKRDKSPEQCVCTGHGVMQRITTRTDLTPSAFQDYSVLTAPTWRIIRGERDPPEGWSKDCAAQCAELEN